MLKLRQHFDSFKIRCLTDVQHGKFGQKMLLLSTLLLMATQVILKLLMVFSVFRHQNEADHAKKFEI